MANYTAPGVYIEELPAPQSIQGVSTSIAGFVGVTEKGPTSGLPVLITSFKDFINKFGGYLPEDPWGDTRFLAYAVEGFFQNGGSVAYVKRVVSGAAAASALTLKDGFVTRLAKDTAVNADKRTTAELLSTRGIQVGTELTFQEVIQGVEQSEKATVISYDGNTVTLDAPLTQRYTQAGCSVFIDADPAVRPEDGDESLVVTASTLGTAGQRILVQVSDHTGAVGATGAAGATTETKLVALTLAFANGGPDTGATEVELDANTYALVQEGDEIEFSDGDTPPKTNIRTITETDDDNNLIKWAEPLANSFTAGSATAIRRPALRPGKGDDTIEVEDATDLTGGDLVRITSGMVTQVVEISNVNGTTLTLDTTTYPVTKTFEAGATLLRGDSTPTDATLLLRSVNNFYEHAVIEIDTGAVKHYRTVTDIDTTQRTLTVDPDLSGESIPPGTPVRVVEFALTLDDGITTEVYPGLTLAEDTPGYAPDVINNQSNLVVVEVKNSARAIPFNLPATPLGVAVPLAGGDDGGVPGVDDFIGQDNGPGNRTGIKALADIDEVSIIAAPGISDVNVQNELIIQCETLKDRFAVLDPAAGSPLDQTAQGIIGQRGNFDTRYAAMYYPWLRIRDPLNPNQRGGTLLPPSGHVIGVYARVDNERGVFKAPANEVIRGIIGLEVKLNEAEHGVLNQENINVIRDFRGDNRGLRVFGARCLTSDNANKYVPVRRLLIFIEESLQEGLQWVVFEPNAEALWQEVKRTVRGFLRTVWRAGGLEGVIEDDAFRVFCNIHQTMTEDDVANGRLIVEVWVAPVRPAEFVIVRINRLTREAQA